VPRLYVLYLGIWLTTYCKSCFQNKHELAVIASSLYKYIRHLSQIDMEGTTSFILQLVLVFAFVCLACGQSCPSQNQTSAKFTVSSQRNQTGHWISQVKVQIHTAYMYKSRLLCSPPVHTSSGYQRASCCMSAGNTLPGLKWAEREHK